MNISNFVAHSAKFKMKYLNVKYRSWSCQDGQKLRNNASSHYPTTILALCIYFLQYETPLFKAHANGRNKCQQLPTLLGVFGQQCCVRLHGPKSLTGFKLYATSANIVVVPCKRTQQVTTLLGPTMLGVVGQQCWVRLHGPLEFMYLERED